MIKIVILLGTGENKWAGEFVALQLQPKKQNKETNKQTKKAIY